MTIPAAFSGVPLFRRVVLRVAGVLGVGLWCAGMAAAQEPPAKAPPVPPAAAQAEAPPADPGKPRWWGTLVVPHRELRLLISEGRTPDGAAVYRLRSLDEGNHQFELDSYREEAGQLSFEIKRTAAVYAGERSEDGAQARGTWRQRGGEFPLNWQRVEQEPRDAPGEIWGGQLSLLLQKLELRFRFYQPGTPQQRVLMDSVTQQAGGFVAEFRRDGDHWELNVPGVQGKFVGTQRREDRVVEGKWHQGLLGLSLQLRPVDPTVPSPPPAPRRPQTPRPPFPYDVEEVRVENAADQVTLSGTLTLPRETPPRGAILLLAGSGPHDRDETLFGHQPLLVLADFLTRRGYAVLRYDKRGVGRSTGDLALATSESLARDAVAALEFLRRDPRLQSTRLGLIGHSEGGLVGGLVAARHKELAWLVMLAGPGVDGEQILRSQGERILAVEQFDAAVQRRQQQVQQAILAAIKETAPDADPQVVTDRALEAARQTVGAAEFDAQQLGPAVAAGARTMHAPWFRFFLTHDPAATLRRVSLPVLALQGAQDVQVIPELNLPPLEAALREGGNAGSRVQTLPGLNHLFQRCRTGAVREYAEIEETMAPEALEALDAWLRERS
ncbi:MAG: alpha/beta fold hydrolase [Pirellulales bacterium]